MATKTPETEASIEGLIKATREQFADAFTLEESARQAHYRAIENLYGAVAFLVQTDDRALTAAFKDRKIDPNKKNTNEFLPYIRLIFSEKDTANPKTYYKGEGKNRHEWIEYPWKMDKKFNRYAGYVRWLFEHKVPVNEAAITIAEKTLESIAAMDRDAHSDPEIKKARETETKKKLNKFSGWGSFKLTMTDDAAVSPGLNQFIVDVKASGECRLLWVDPKPKAASLASRVTGPKNTKPTASNVLSLDDATYRPAEIDHHRQMASAVSAKSSYDELIRKA